MPRATSSLPLNHLRNLLHVTQRRAAKCYWYATGIPRYCWSRATWPAHLRPWLPNHVHGHVLPQVCGGKHQRNTCEQVEEHEFC